MWFWWWIRLSVRISPSFLWSCIFSDILFSFCENLHTVDFLFLSSTNNLLLIDASNNSPFYRHCLYFRSCSLPKAQFTIPNWFCCMSLIFLACCRCYGWERVCIFLSAGRNRWVEWFQWPNIETALKHPTHDACSIRPPLDIVDILSVSVFCYLSFTAHILG